MPILKTIKKSKIILDTHVLIWLVSGNSKLSSGFRKIVIDIEKSGSLLISPISIWEVGMLEAKGCIKLDKNCYDWMDEVLCHPNLSLAPISPKIAIDSSRLTGEYHVDPADRILIATAIDLRAVLVTADEKIIAYGTVSSTLDVMNPI